MSMRWQKKRAEQKAEPGAGCQEQGLVGTGSGEILGKVTQYQVTFWGKKEQRHIRIKY